MGAAQATGSESARFDVTLLPIEQLVETEYIPASRIARQISDAPSAVSIVTAQDIRDYGYRTLSEILKSMRGLYVTPSLTYDYLGGRGLGQPGDYVGRIMLMIDGYVTNDNIFNQVYIGRESPLDVELIERVEYIPGPGSTTYGNNAFLGVINIVTKRGRDFSGAQVSAGFGNESARQRSRRFTYGRQFENGAEILLSASHYEDGGRSVHIPFSESEDLVFRQHKKTRSDRIFFKGAYEGWSLEASHARHSLSRRFYEIIGGVEREGGGVDPAVDTINSLSLKHDARLHTDLSASAHIYLGQYRYRSDHEYVDMATEERFDLFREYAGSWWGADIKFVGTWFNRHRLLFGGEYRHDFRQQEFLGDSSFRSTLFDSRARVYSAYVQDEYRATEHLTLIPGIRYDYNSEIGGALSPRFAAIYQPWPATTFKLSHGRAFRTRSPWEESMLRDFPVFSTSSKRERVATSELVWQQQFTGNTRLTASLYRSAITDPVAKDYLSLETTGQEIGFEYVSGAGTRMNMSVARQRVRTDQGWEPYNTPRWLAKLNIAQPLFEHRMTAGLSVQTTGRRSTADGMSVKAGTVANLTLNSDRLIKDANVSFSIRNLFNTRLHDVLDRDLGGMGAIPLPRRNLWLQVEYTFK